MSEALAIERREDCWTFTLNRPEKRNALSPDLIEALISDVDNAHAQDIPLLVFQGAGRNFSAGFDFTAYESQSEGDLVLRMVRIETLLQSIAASPSLTLAFAHGRNFGAGVDLFAACKLRYCTPDASFRMPGLKFGLVLGTGRFLRLVGEAAALSILGNARTFDAQEAVDIGFVQSAVPQAQWSDSLDEAIESAGRLCAQTRASLYRVLDSDHADRDMAALVKSAARPGLKARIETYLGTPAPAAK